MKIALLGYGNMGQEIQRLVDDHGEHEISSISYKNRSEGLDVLGFTKSDVAIDFTSPNIVIENIKFCMKSKVPLVVGTTGWHEDMKSVEKIVRQGKGSLIFGQNFSVGANIFFKIVANASLLLSRYEEYDVFGIETHHIGKKDSPSGTAKKLADVVMQNFPKKKNLQTNKLNRQIRKDELHFASVRGGRNFGKHEIVYDSQSDEIRLMHQAWGRVGFAKGALLAAEFIKDKKGIYNFSDLFDTSSDKLSKI